MNNIIIEATSESDAIKLCLLNFGWLPNAVREVDSGKDGIKAFMCFESAADAELWDNQS